jgi:hypothetical protein
MHFCTDVFWEKINMVTDKGAIMVFNLLEIDLNNTIFTRKGNMVEYMFPIHKTVKTEPYIDNIDEYLQKYNWSIVSTYKTSGSNILTDYYRWYHIIKN